MLTLYQFNSCPFCWKVKALLHYTKTPYGVVEVTPFGMKEIDFTEHKKVPILRDADKIMVESAAIVQYINQQYGHLPALPRDGEWAQWVDGTLVHYLPPLIHPDMRQSFKNFGLIMAGSKDGLVKRFLVRLMGAFVMPRVANKMKLKHHIVHPAAEFQAAINHWVQEGLAGQAFFGGEQPGLMDTSVYGVLHAAHGMGILEAVEAQNAEFSRWYNACNAQMAKP